jgi:2-amino-4-hydroxy-6-hydroxymethyldihydropteridine diphosphokinase
MRIWIGMGSNMGDRWEHLTAARAALAALPGVQLEAFSRFWSNPPIGGPQGQGTFLNAAAQLRLDDEANPKLSWLERAEWLLDQLQAIERQRGTAKTTRWDQRPLDLDLLLVGPEQVGSSARLRIPHPRMTHHRFVLVPLHEIAPHVAIPPLNRTVADLLTHLDRQPRIAMIVGPDAPRFAQRLLDHLAHPIPPPNWIIRPLINDPNPPVPPSQITLIIHSQVVPPLRGNNHDHSLPEGWETIPQVRPEFDPLAEALAALASLDAAVIPASEQSHSPTADSLPPSSPAQEPGAG